MNLWLVFAAAFLGEASSPPPGAMADAAGNRQVPLETIEAPPEDETAVPTACTEDSRWCVSLAWGGEAPELLLVDLASDDDGIELEPRRLPLDPPAEGEGGAVTLWPRLVLQADGAVIAGLERTRSAAYSGGGAEAGALELYLFPAAGGPAARLLEAPVSGRATIRACFSEADARDRAGACADEYEYRGELALDPAVAEGRPRFVLTARARTFPGRRSRSADSLAGPPLTSADLVWADDPECSFRRAFAFDPASGLYAPDRPLPPCEDYIEP